MQLRWRCGVGQPLHENRVACGLFMRSWTSWTMNVRRRRWRVWWCCVQGWHGGATCRSFYHAIGHAPAAPPLRPAHFMGKFAGSVSIWMIAQPSTGCALTLAVGSRGRSIVCSSARRPVTRNLLCEGRGSPIQRESPPVMAAYASQHNHNPRAVDPPPNTLQSSGGPGG